jgi:hypothetical protein
MLTVDAHDIGKIPVLMTIVGEKIAYDASGGAYRRSPTPLTRTTHTKDSLHDDDPWLTGMIITDSIGGRPRLLDLLI